MIIEISVAIIAIALIFLVTYLIYLFKSIHGSVCQVNLLITDFRQQMDEMKEESKKIVENTREISVGLKQKMEALNPLFQSIATLGDVLDYKAEVFRQKTLRACNRCEKEEMLNSSQQTTKEEELTRKIKEHSLSDPSLVAEIFELASLGLRLWQNLKIRR